MTAGPSGNAAVSRETLHGCLGLGMPDLQGHAGGRVCDDQRLAAIHLMADLDRMPPLEPTVIVVVPEAHQAD
jgi:hypothetical protein